VGTLMAEVMSRARDLGVAFSVHLDLTYRCNERCLHCYLEHDDCGELETWEVKSLLDDLAAAGVFFLAISGGEIFLRRDIFAILEHARLRSFNVKLKTNATLIGPTDADRIRSLRVDEVQVSVYSHHSEIHDGLTLVPGSLRRSINAIRLLRSYGQKVTIAHIVTRLNVQDAGGVRALADELGTRFRIDPTITPKLNGNTGPLGLNISHPELIQIMRNPDYVRNAEEFCAPPAPADDAALDDIPCSAGHNHCYISPYGEVFPCVQLPLACGNVRERNFADIWRESKQMNLVRSIRTRDLPVCSGCSHVAKCSRCPGLAFMAGDLRGPSLQDCRKSYARTGIVPSAIARSAV
jgi:AdoMet-dependent heme synthase